MFGGGDYGITNQFAAGGFMPSQQNDAGYGGGAQQKGRGGQQQTLRAVTIRQIVQNMGNSDGDNLRVDGADLQNVTLVGKIVSVVDAAVRYRMVLSDGTGQAEVLVWLSGDNEMEAQNKKQLWQPGRYVRVYGHVRYADQKYAVNAFTIRIIHDFNEVTHHFLQCIFQHLHITKQLGSSSGGGGGAVASSYAAGGNWGGNAGGGYGGAAAGGGGYGAGGAGGGGAAMGGASGSCQDAVMAIMHECAANSDGLHINEVVTRLQGRFNRAQVKDALDALANEALVYTTTDDEHFRAS